MSMRNQLKKATGSTGKLIIALTFICFHSNAQQHLSKVAVQMVDSIVAQYNSHISPGGIIATIASGRVIYSKAFGMANLPHQVPVTSETLFNIGSAAKQFTGFAFTLLANQKKLSLEDNIRKYLPGLPECMQNVTLRHLLTHSSGLRDGYTMLALSGRIPNQNLLKRSDILNVYRRQQHLEFEPGSKFQYNSTTYVLLAQILEKITGQPFPTWMNQHVFEPMQMKNTFIESQPEQVIAGAADSYTLSGETGYTTSFGNRAFYGAGDIYSSVKDLARWCHNFSTSEIGGEMAQTTLRAPYVLSTSQNTSYGLGIFVDKYKGLKRVHHSGSHAGFKASVIYFPEIDQGLITLSNCHPLPSYELADAFFEPYFLAQNDNGKTIKKNDSPAKIETKWRPETSKRRNYVGEYYSQEADLHLSVTSNGQDLVLRRPWQESMSIKPKQGLFYGDFPFSKVEFVENKNGRIKGFLLTTGQTSNIWFERLGKSLSSYEP